MSRRWLRVVPNPHGERRPHAYLALRRQRSTEQVHRLLRNRQPQSGTFRLLATLPLHLTELIEDVRQVFGRDTDARVSNGQLGIAIDVELVARGETAPFTEIDRRQKAIRLIDERSD